jgi:hypothetical protein
MISSVFRAAIKSVLYSSHTLRDGSKFGVPRKTRKESPLFIAIEGHNEPFQQSQWQAKTNIEPTDNPEGWELCETEEGDQYWYNRFSKESTAEVHDDTQKQHTSVVISEPFNVKLRGIFSFEDPIN